MEKYYIVKNENFQNQIKADKENERYQKKFMRDFFEKNGIIGNAYCLCGTGLCNTAFRDDEKENIRLHIEDNEKNNEIFGKQLKKSKIEGLKQFRKNSELLKKFQDACIEEQIIINLRGIFPGNWFEEMQFGGYRSRIFEWDGKVYLKIAKDSVENITPLYKGFEEIRGSEFHKALESVKDAENKGISAS